MISVAIISKSEKIPKQVLDSANFASEIIVVVDSEQKSPKKTQRIKYFYRPLKKDFSAQRNFALSKTTSPWVLFIDDDEYISTELAREIKDAVSAKNISGYFINRIDVCFHQRLMHGETGGQYLLRLAKKESGSFSRSVHELWMVKGKTAKLNSPLYHIKDNLVSGFVGRMSQYSPIDADSLEKENKPFTLWRLLFNPKAKFFQNYFLRLGFLDGTIGLFYAYLMSVQSLTVRVFQWAKTK